LKAPELQFGLDDRPGIWVTLGSAIQHIMLGLVTLTFPLLIINEIYPASILPPDQVYTLMAASFVALGVATLLQGGAFQRDWVRLSGSVGLYRSLPAIEYRGSPRRRTRLGVRHDDICWLP